MAEHSLPEQLLNDCHYLGRLPHSALLLHRNASLPWFIVVPDSAEQDLLDLASTVLHDVLEDCVAVSQFVKQELGYRKVNFAGLGNVVPDMHLHIIGRREGDACWPQPVWGNLPQGGDYTADRLADWQSRMQKAIALKT